MGPLPGVSWASWLATAGTHHGQHWQLDKENDSVLSFLMVKDILHRVLGYEYIQTM